MLGADGSAMKEVLISSKTSLLRWDLKDRLTDGFDEKKWLKLVGEWSTGEKQSKYLSGLTAVSMVPEFDDRSVSIEGMRWLIWSLYFAPFSFPLNPDQSTISCPHSMLPPLCFTVDGIMQVMSSEPWFPPEITLRIETKQVNLGFIVQENLVSDSLRGL